MRHSESATQREHFDLMREFSVFCSDHALLVFEHHFHWLVFGSWTIVVGTSHSRLRFTWDGKEGVLEVAEAVIGSQADRPAWDTPENLAARRSVEAFEAMKVRVASRYAA